MVDRSLERGILGLPRMERRTRLVLARRRRQPRRSSLQTQSRLTSRALAKTPDHSVPSQREILRGEVRLCVHCTRSQDLAVCM